MARDLDKWIEKVKRCEYLQEEELKALTDYVKEILVEESNVQPVNAPVTVSAASRASTTLASRVCLPASPRSGACKLLFFGNETVGRLTPCMRCRRRAGLR